MGDHSCVVVFASDSPASTCSTTQPSPSLLLHPVSARSGDQDLLSIPLPNGCYRSTGGARLPVAADVCCYLIHIISTTP
jgi:hypothetical protein